MTTPSAVPAAIRQRLLVRGRRIARRRGELLAAISDFVVERAGGDRSVATAWFWVEEDRAGSAGSCRIGFFVLDDRGGEIEPLAEGGWSLVDTRTAVAPVAAHTLPSLCLASQHRMMGRPSAGPECRFAHACEWRTVCLRILAENAGNDSAPDAGASPAPQHDAASAERAIT